MKGAHDSPKKAMLAKGTSLQFISDGDAAPGVPGLDRIRIGRKVPRTADSPLDWNLKPWKGRVPCYATCPFGDSLPLGSGPMSRQVVVVPSSCLA